MALALAVLHTVELIGLLLFVGSVFFRRPDAPKPSFNPKNWTPIWRQESHFRGPGFIMMFFGLELFSLAFVADLTLRLCK